ncbi:hypothetical protein GCM10009678_56740 [Actinomadura kijaniata]
MKVRKRFMGAHHSVALLSEVPLTPGLPTFDVTDERWTVRDLHGEFGDGPSEPLTMATHLGAKQVERAT